MGNVVRGGGGREGGGRGGRTSLLLTFQTTPCSTCAHVCAGKANKVRSMHMSVTVGWFHHVAAGSKLDSLRGLQWRARCLLLQDEEGEEKAIIANAE